MPGGTVSRNFPKRSTHALTRGEEVSASDLAMAARMPGFNGLKREMLDALLREATVAKLGRGQLLFRQGDTAVSVVIIVEGWVKLYRVTPAGDEVVLNVLSEGESFTDAVTISAAVHTVSACAVTRCRVLVIPADHVVNCIREMPEIAIALVAATSMHLRQMVQRVEQLTSQSAIQRVADFLISFAPCTQGACRIALPYDKSLIAGRLGLKPESLSRVFAKLRLVGIDVRVSEAVVSDVAVLRRLVINDQIRFHGSEKRGQSESFAVLR
ncbi:MAG: Crp/Fnr family transcriptional regulator [Alphaproteobacteria bacterium]|nr:Crp/Fnr family transcriptional regulator [Alphaproteobacteria bacterium]